MTSGDQPAGAHPIGFVPGMAKEAVSLCQSRQKA
jgi:hypothetical protein